MAKRIVEETLYDGTKKYRVQNNTIFGIPTCWWFDEGIQMITNANNFNTHCTVAAVYDTLHDAENYLTIKGCVQSRKVIKTYSNKNL